MHLIGVIFHEFAANKTEYLFKIMSQLFCFFVFMIIDVQHFKRSIQI